MIPNEVTHIDAVKIDDLPQVRGRYTENAPLGTTGWFRTGGQAHVLFRPADHDDLAHFLSECPADIPITVLGVMSNTIVRDGGIPGVTIRLGRDFADIETLDDFRVRAGSVALDANVSMAAARNNIGGLEFFSGIPGTIGGALRMNAGAYGTETKDVLIEATAIDRQGTIHKLTPADMGMTYRHTTTPQDYIFIEALFQGQEDKEDLVQARITDIKNRRSSTQPIKSKTGGSTFANPTPEELEAVGLPAGTKTWQLIDKAGGRGLQIGGAMMSELHCNFMINTGDATANDLETLGEEIRKRVHEQSGYQLRWEIRRIGSF